MAALRRVDGGGSTTRAEGLRLLAAGESDLHCGGIDDGLGLPGFLRRERFLDMTAGIVAWRGHPLLAGKVTEDDLVHSPWVDFDATAAPARRSPPCSNTSRTRMKTILRAGSGGLSVMADGPWLARLPLEPLGGLPGLELRPLDTAFGRHRYRAGFVARRAAGDLASFRLLVRTVSSIALGNL